jgi:hypothetical protein
MELCVFLAEIFESLFLSELLSYDKRVLLHFFFLEKASPSPLSTWMPGLVTLTFEHVDARAHSNFDSLL